MTRRAAARLGAVCLAGAGLCVLTSATAAQSPPLPPKARFHLFLLVGQSNMAGRGDVTPDDRQPHPRVMTLSKDAQWVPAVDPIHFDKPIAGVGPGRAFGIALADAAPDITIGLIPAAVGGSPIDAWRPGAYYEPTASHPWDDALRRAQRAMRDGTLRGILWHQGESDASAELAPAYAAKLHDLVGRWRAALHAPDVPFIVGQLGRFADRPWHEFKEDVDRAHRTLPATVPLTAFVSADGLGHGGDGLHFDATSARLLGRRYAEAYHSLRGDR